MVFVQIPCKRGFGTGTVTEYWLTLPAARRVALEYVNTTAAKELRAQVTEQLERLIEEKPMALQAPSDTAAIVLALKAGFESQAELVRGLLQPPKPPSLYIDDERVHLLRCLARDLATARGERTMQPVWKAMQLQHGFITAKPKSNPRVFETVTVELFDRVLAQLRAELESALKAPKKVTSLMKRPVSPTGNALDIQAVARRLEGMNLEVPTWALPDWGEIKGLYTMVGVLTYTAPPSGKKSDIQQAVHIDESSVPVIADWCTTHPTELLVFLSNRRALNGVLDARQKAGRSPRSMN